MSQCKCGYSTDPENKCNGTHNIVFAVRKKIIQDIEAIEIEPSITNAVGMKAMALKAAKG